MKGARGDWEEGAQEEGKAESRTMAGRLKTESLAVL